MTRLIWISLENSCTMKKPTLYISVYHKGDEDSFPTPPIYISSLDSLLGAKRNKTCKEHAWPPMCDSLKRFPASEAIGTIGGGSFCFKGLNRGLLVWFNMVINVPANNFSVMLGWSNCFLGIHQYFGELKVSSSRTLHGGRGVRKLRLSLRSPTLYH